VYNTTYGTQKGNRATLNADATYAYSDTGSFSAYWSQQNRLRSMTDLARGGTATTNSPGTPIGGTWTEKLSEVDTVIGLGFKQAGLLGGKLELIGDLTYSLAKTSQKTVLNYLSANAAGLFCDNPAVLTCGSLPDIRNAITQFKLTGTYDLDKSSKVAMGYMFKLLNASNYYYNGLQYGTTPTSLLPNNLQPGSYKENIVGLSYQYVFK